MGTISEIHEVDEINHLRIAEINISSQRKAHDYSSFKKEYKFLNKEHKDGKQIIASALRENCNPDTCCTLNKIWNFANHRFPVLSWGRKYNFRRKIGNDIIAGITVGIMHIPHGMAYGILANVSPVNGLYVSFFPVLVYLLLGTSRHVSIGTFAVISIMLGKAVEDVLIKRPDLILVSNVTNVSAVLAADEECVHMQAAVEIVMAICFVVGIIQMAFGMLQLGILSVFLSDILVSGFTTGTAVHIFSAQIKHILGVQVPSRSGLFKVIHSWIDVFSAIQFSNYIAVSVSAVAIVFLEVVNRFLNPRIQTRFKFVIPVELIVIILGTATCHVGNLETAHNLKTVGTIPTGIPAPRAIKWDLLPDIVIQSFPIAIVSFTTLLSLGKLLAKKGAYKVNANQDLFAIGMANMASSFFSCYPCSVSLSRSLLQFSTGGKTQVASLVSSLFIMAILLSIGPLFQELPYCILASVIVVSISKMFRQVRDMTNAWAVCKLDSIVWLVTFLTVVIFDVDIGLGIGLLATIVSVVFQSRTPKSSLLGLIPKAEIYADIEKYKMAEEVNGFKIFRFYAAPYFANKDYFRKELFRLVGLNPVEILARQKKLQAKKKLRKNSGELPNEDSLMNQGSANTSEIPLEVHSVIIDCSNWNFIDTAGLSTIEQVIQEYRAIGMTVFLSGCLDPVLETIERQKTYDEFFKDCIFPSVSDITAKHAQTIQVTSI